jgi:uncharacterized membrane protein
MSFRFLLILFLFSAFIGISACTYNKEDELYVQSNVQICDTTSVTFNNQVKEILQTDCLNCHSNENFQSLGGRKNLQGYANAASASSRILSRVIDDQNPMPPSQNGRLSSCKIDKIRAWINQGKSE